VETTLNLLLDTRLDIAIYITSHVIADPRTAFWT
jgi:hypothetical protein